MSWLKSQGVSSAVHYPIAIVDQTAMSGTGCEVIGEITAAREICRCEVSLPIHPYLTGEEVGQVIEVCNRWKN